MYSNLYTLYPWLILFSNCFYAEKAISKQQHWESLVYFASTCCAEHCGMVPGCADVQVGQAVIKGAAVKSRELMTTHAVSMASKAQMLGLNQVFGSFPDQKFVHDTHSTDLNAKYLQMQRQIHKCLTCWFVNWAGLAYFHFPFDMAKIFYLLTRVFG